jgi:hypothetical protein
MFSRMSCHLKCFETIDETTPKINDFILQFHNTKFYFLLVIYEILIDLNATFMSIHFFETVHTRFYLDETLLIYFFINSLSCMS